MTATRLASVVAAALMAACILPAAGAPPPPPPQQQPSGPPNALQGFSQNRDQPVKIDALTLEVRDKDKIATFSGNVHLVQGDTTLRCKTLVVYYDQDQAAGAAKTSSVGPTGSQQIRRMVAKGEVVVTKNDQTATGENGVYDMPANTVTLIGSVVVTQGQNVIKGGRLIVDLTTGISHVEGGPGEPVQSLIIPKSAPTAPAAESKPAPETRAAPPAQAPKPQQQRSLHPSGLY